MGCYSHSRRTKSQLTDDLEVKLLRGDCRGKSPCQTGRFRCVISPLGGRLIPTVLEGGPFHHGFCLPFKSITV
jgi:hypothetical protein